MNDYQQTLDNNLISPEIPKILRELHNGIINNEIPGINFKFNFNKYWHYKDKQLDNYI